MSAAPRQRRAADRVQGLLLMLPWLVERRRVSINDMANTFDLSVEELLQDLNMATFCGTPPYSPLELIEIFFDDDHVWVEVPRIFTKALRLSVAEAFAMRAVATAALALPGAGSSSALASAIEKLNAVTAFDEALVIEQPSDPRLQALAEYCQAHAKVSLGYFSPITDKASTREVAPQRVWLGSEHWYLDAVDLASNEPRVFRIDRITELADTGERVDPATLPSLADEPGFHWGSDTEEVTLHLSPGAHWVAEKYPAFSKKKLDDDTVEVVLPVSSEPWLGRLLVRAGSDARVVNPARLATLGQESARKILVKYGV